MRKRQYDAEFKKEMAKACIEGRRSASSLATELGVHENTVNKWIKSYQSDPIHAFPGTGHMKPEEAEISKAKRRIRELEEEVEMLKKAAAYLAKNSR